MSTVGEIKKIVERALDDHLSCTEEDKEEGAFKKIEQRAARHIQAALDSKYGGNWNVILGKKISVAASVGQGEGYAMFQVKDYFVFVFQYNAK